MQTSQPIAKRMRRGACLISLLCCVFVSGCWSTRGTTSYDYDIDSHGSKTYYTDVFGKQLRVSCFRTMNSSEWDIEYGSFQASATSREIVAYCSAATVLVAITLLAVLKRSRRSQRAEE